MSPEVGQPAPDFTLRDQNLSLVRLAELRGSAVLLVFFPFAFTSVCTGELQALTENRSALPGHLLALSCDPVGALKAFARSEGFDFPLLSDFWPHGAVAASYGVFDAQRGAARRASFLIDASGVLRWRVATDWGQPRLIADYRAALAEIG